MALSKTLSQKLKKMKKIQIKDDEKEVDTKIKVQQISTFLDGTPLVIDSPLSLATRQVKGMVTTAL